MAKSRGSAADAAIEGLLQLEEAVRSGESLPKRFTVRMVELDLEPTLHDAESIRSMRESLGVSQSVFAAMLGASTHTIQSWEQGKRRPSRMACQVLDEMKADPQRWLQWLKARATHKDVCSR